MSNHLPIVILNGRPAAGKSEVIDYLKHCNDSERANRFGVAPFVEFDDFPILWEDFQDDDIREKMGLSRLVTDHDYYFTDNQYWNFLIQKLSFQLEYQIAKVPDFLSRHTAIIEFSRGGQNGFKDAFENLSDRILSKAVIVYIAVSYAESSRKNQRRARPGEEGSILYHSLPQSKMDFYYKVNDWEKISGSVLDGVIEIRGFKVPFTVLPNEPEVTDTYEHLGPALEFAFTRLARHRKKLLQDHS